jgi:hypothetical protein
VQQGCAATIEAAFSLFFTEQSKSILKDYVAQHDSVKPWAKAPASADRLWKLIEQIVSQNYV